MVGIAIAIGIHSGMNIRITKQIGVGSMGGVVVILTRGMGKRLTYRIPAHYHVVFDGVSGRLVLRWWALLCWRFYSLVTRVCTAASLSW